MNTAGAVIALTAAVADATSAEVETAAEVPMQAIVGMAHRQHVLVAVAVARPALVPVPQGAVALPMGPPPPRHRVEAVLTVEVADRMGVAADHMVAANTARGHLVIPQRRDTSETSEAKARIFNWRFTAPFDFAQGRLWKACPSRTHLI